MKVIMKKLVVVN